MARAVEAVRTTWRVAETLPRADQPCLKTALHRSIAQMQGVHDAAVARKLGEQTERYLRRKTNARPGKATT